MTVRLTGDDGQQLHLPNKRGVRVIALLALISGIILAADVHRYLAPGWLNGLSISCLGLSALGLGVGWGWRWKKPAQSRYIVYRPGLICLSLTLGLIVWQQAYHHATRWQLPQTLTNPVNVSVDATIIGLPAPKTHSTEVTIAVSPQALAAVTGMVVPLSKEDVRLRLQWYQLTQPLWPGQRWQLQLRLRPIHGFQNPGSFDYVSWLQQQDIQAVGSVVDAKRLAASQSLSLRQRVDRLRAQLRQYQIQTLASSPLAGVLTALSLGDKSLVSLPVQRVFINTGTAHLLAISGLHVGLVAGLMCWLWQWLWRFGPRFCLWCPAKTAGLAMGVVTAWGYALLAGLAVSTQRAAVMVTFAAIGLGCQRKLAWSFIWVFTLALVLALSPLSVTSSGLWLSFLAVLALSYLNLRPKQPQRWRAWLGLQISITLLLAPLMLALFQQVSLAAIPANLLAIPWIGTIIVPMTLVGTLLQGVWPYAAHLLLNLALHLLVGFWPLLTWFADLPAVTWHGGVSSMTALLLGLLGSAWLFAPRGIPLKHLGWGLLLPAGLNPSVTLPGGGVQLTVLDAGQGLATVIRTQQHTLIYDTGPGDPQGFNAGSVVLVPFLRDRGIRHVNLVVLSHGDNDHIAGLPALGQSYGPIPVLTSAPARIRQVLKLNAAWSVHLCQAGMHWRWDGVDFAIRYPRQQDLGLDNNSSCVLQIHAGGKTVLLPGDIELRAEQLLVQQDASKLASDIIVVPHHGSAGAAWPQFIMTVAPKYAIFSTGFMNRFHFPRSRVLGLYQVAHSQILNTAYDGAVSVTISPEGQMQVSTTGRTQ